MLNRKVIDWCLIALETTAVLVVVAVLYGMMNIYG